MANFDLEKFKAFKEESSRAGYAGEDKKNETKEPDGSTTLSFESGDWKFHDNYFGGEPYGGRVVYSYKGKPVHLTVYYGRLNETEDADVIYKFLRKALRGPEKEEIRGPKEFKEEELVYKNRLKGTIENFSLEEKIFRKGKKIYIAKFIGGLVDQREGD